MRRREREPHEHPGCGFSLFAGCGVITVCMVVCFGFIGLLHHQGELAEPAVDAFSAKLAAHDYKGAYQVASPYLRSHQSEAEFVHRASYLDRVLGAVESRRLESIGVHSAPNSHKVITVHYAAQFHGQPGTLIVTVDDVQEGDLKVRAWHVVAKSVGSIVLGASEGHQPKPALTPAPAGARQASSAPVPSAASAPRATPDASPSPSPVSEHHESQ